MAGHNTSDFKRRLQSVPRRIRAEVNAAIAKDATEWVRLSRHLVPQDPKDGTPLHDSIRSYETETGGQVVRAGGETTTKPSAGGPYDYALAQEFGNQEVPAQPFYWPAYRLLKKKFANRRARALRKAIKDANNG
jgi:HK97 gp10 family phage protein